MNQPATQNTHRHRTTYNCQIVIARDGNAVENGPWVQCQMSNSGEAKTAAAFDVDPKQMFYALRKEMQNPPPLYFLTDEQVKILKDAGQDI